MKRAAAPCSVICLCWLAACGSGPAEDGEADPSAVGARAQAIAGAQPVDALFGAVGALMKGRSRLLCPATLVGARMVLASARCALSATHFVIFDGAQMTRSSLKSKRVHPKHTPGQAAFDVALLELAEQPAVVRPSALVSSAPRVGLALDIPTAKPSAEDVEKAGGRGEPARPLITARVATLGPLLLQTSAGASDRSGSCRAPRGMPVFADLGAEGRRALVGLLSEAADSDCGAALRLDALLPWLTLASKGEVEIVDTVAPTLSIDRPNPGDKLVDRVQVLAFAADDRALESVALRVDGALRGVSDSGDVRLNLELAPGVHVVELEARDRAGNTQTERVRFSVYGSATPRSEPPLAQIQSTGPGDGELDERVTTVYGGCSAAPGSSHGGGDAELPGVMLLIGAALLLLRRRAVQLRR